MRTIAIAVIIWTLIVVACVITLASLTPARASECGNVVHNLIRARECEAYADSDWGKINNLRDVRTKALEEWMAKYSGSGRSLELITKEADIKRSHSLTRDTQIFGKDADMWTARGCGELPLCVKAVTTEKIDPTANPTPVPEKQVRDTEGTAPVKRRAGRNRRTGGDYCGPRDTARGYCD